MLVLLFAPAAAGAQQQGGLTLEQARAIARQTSPDVAAARAAAEAAAGRARQAGAFPNPVLSYGREQTSRGDVTNAQDIVALEQRLEIGGQRGARTEVARLRQEAAEARLAAAEAELELAVARAYADVVAASRRAELAAQAADQFRRAVRVTEERFAAGDVSGYAARRIRLEAVRYEALAAEMMLEEREARLRLAALLGAPADTALAGLVPVADGEAGVLHLPPDSVAALALQRSPQLRAELLETQAARAEAKLARRERIPTPVASAGYKNERVAPGEQTFDGFVAGVSIPLPLWDRRGGAVQAAEAEARREAAETEARRRQVAREAREAYEAVRRTDEQVASLRAQLGDEARAALRAAEAAYAEGEITLVEWLDAVRAYQEAEAAYARLLAESFTQRAALERLLGVALIR